MNEKKIIDLLKETAYPRVSGTADELLTAQFLQRQCAELGGNAVLEPFEVEVASIRTQRFFVDEKEIPCKGYWCAGNGDVEAPFYYMTTPDPWSLSQCRGKIVLLNDGIRRWLYEDLLKNGAVGLITYSGNANYDNRDISQLELRAHVCGDIRIPIVSIHAKDALMLVDQSPERARIVLEQSVSTGSSHNVVMELPGELPDWILLSAHYDSVAISQGAYDNMSGCIGLLGIAEYFLSHPHRYGLRFIWCGSEERGLLGAKTYAKQHQDESEHLILDINLDMIGCKLGRFVACCTAEDGLVHYLRYFAAEVGAGISVVQDVYPCDSTAFADAGIPAVTFSRDAPGHASAIHCRYDTADIIHPRHLLQDIDFLTAFADRMANAQLCPVRRELPPSIQEKLEVYFSRKRPDETAK